MDDLFCMGYLVSHFLLLTQQKVLDPNFPGMGNSRD